MQIRLAKKIYDENLNVRETEKLVKNILEPKVTAPKENNRQINIIYENLENKMKDILGTKVSIKRKDDKKGKIEIEYYSVGELEHIIEIISGR